MRTVLILCQLQLNIFFINDFVNCRPDLTVCKCARYEGSSPRRLCQPKPTFISFAIVLNTRQLQTSTNYLQVDSLTWSSIKVSQGIKILRVYLSGLCQVEQFATWWKKLVWCSICSSFLNSPIEVTICGVQLTSNSTEDSNMSRKSTSRINT